MHQFKKPKLTFPNSLFQLNTTKPTIATSIPHLKKYKSFQEKKSSDLRYPRCSDKSNQVKGGGGGGEKRITESFTVNLLVGDRTREVQVIDLLILYLLRWDGKSSSRSRSSGGGRRSKARHCVESGKGMEEKQARNKCRNGDGTIEKAMRMRLI